MIETLEASCVSSQISQRSAREIGSLLAAVESKVERRMVEIEAGLRRGRTGRSGSDYRRIARRGTRWPMRGRFRHALRILKTRRQKARRVVPMIIEATWEIDELTVEAVARALAQVKGRSLRIVVYLGRDVVVDADQPGLFDQGQEPA